MDRNQTDKLAGDNSLTKVVHASIMTILAISVALVFTAPRASAAILEGWALDSTTIYINWDPECVSDVSEDPCNWRHTTDYRIYLRNGSFMASWELIQSIDNPGVKDYTVIGLQPSTTYQFYIDEVLDSWEEFQSNIITVQTYPSTDDGGSVTGETDSTIWIFSTAFLSVIVAGLTAGLLLAVRVQLSHWFRKAMEKRKKSKGN